MAHRRWLLASALLGALVWLPPAVEEVTQPRGNLSTLATHALDPPGPVVGWRGGAELVVNRLDASALLTGSFAVDGYTAPGSLVPGTVLLFVWLAAAVAARWAGHHDLVRLHAVLGAALALGVVAASRISGGPWNYLLLWVWGILALVLLAVAWTVLRVSAERLPRLAPPGTGRLAPGALVAVAVAFTTAAAIDAGGVEVHDPARSAVIGRAVPPTLAALAGRAGPHLVTWSDPTHIPVQGWGFLLELERQGLDVGAVPGLRTTVGAHRVLERGAARTRVHLSVGPDIDVWRARGDARQIVLLEGANPDGSSVAVFVAPGRAAEGE